MVVVADPPVKIVPVIRMGGVDAAPLVDWINWPVSVPPARGRTPRFVRAAALFALPINVSISDDVVRLAIESRSQVVTRAIRPVVVTGAIGAKVIKSAWCRITT